MLLSKEQFDGLVIKNEIMGKQTLENEDILIQVGAGENRDEFVHRSIEQWYCGTENLVSIPGTIGAAPVQNIGAYGVEAKDIIFSVTGVHTDTWEIQTLNNAACDFSYRNSIFKAELKDYIAKVATTES